MRVHSVLHKVTHGIGGSGVFVDGREIVPGVGKNGMPDWFGDRVLHCAEGLGVVSRPAMGGEPTIESPHAASFVRACPEGWAAWSDRRGVWTSAGFSLPKAVLLDVCQGAVLVGDDYQSGVGLTCYTLAGQRLWAEPTARPALFFPYAQAALLDAERAVWTERLDLFGRGIDVRDVPWGVFHPTVFDVDGVPWVAYLRATDDAAIAHPANDFSSGVIGRGGYGPVGTYEDDHIILRWSRTAGEGSGDITRHPFKPADLVALDVPPTKEVHVEPVNRPVWVVPFHATRHGRSTDAAGHAEIITDGQDARIRRVRRPVIADLKSLSTVDDLLGIFGVIGLDGFNEARAAARERHVLFLAYFDSHAAFPVDALLEGDIACVMAYCEPAESVPAFDARVRRQLSHVSASGHRIAVVVQMYDRNGKERDRAKLSALQPLWREWVDDFPAVLMIAPFAAIREGGIYDPNGVRDYPELGAWLQAYAVTFVAPPRSTVPIPPEDPMAPTVPDYSHIVTEVFNAGGHDLRTHDGCGRFTEAVVLKLNAIDRNVGHLVKRPEQNNYRGHGLDAFLYLHPAPHLSQAVDIIVNSDDPATVAIGWTVDIPRYTAADWRHPVTGDQPVPPAPGPVPVPTPTPSSLLDAPLSPAFPVAYEVWINRWREIEAAARAWYERSRGHAPADSDIAHGLWRALNEGHRWKTLRRAFEDTWPGGAPKAGS